MALSAKQGVAVIDKYSMSGHKRRIIRISDQEDIDHTLQRRSTLLFRSVVETSHNTHRELTGGIPSTLHCKPAERTGPASSDPVAAGPAGTVTSLDQQQA